MPSTHTAYSAEGHARACGSGARAEEELAIAERALELFREEWTNDFRSEISDCKLEPDGWRETSLGQALLRSYNAAQDRVIGHW